MKVQLYAVEGSSYDGCEGWNSWIMTDSITANKKEAEEFAGKHKSTYIRTEVVDFKTIDVEE